mgnify:CR=1 FL=1
MDKHITIYIKSECPFCIKAQQELVRKKISHTTFIMDDDLDALAEQKEKWGHTTVPIVLEHSKAGEGPGRLIGGWTELSQHLSGDEE